MAVIFMNVNISLTAQIVWIGKIWNASKNVGKTSRDIDKWKD